MDWYKFDVTGAVLSGDGSMIKCDVHGDATTVELDGGFGCRACATEAYANAGERDALAAECGRLRGEVETTQALLDEMMVRHNRISDLTDENERLRGEEAEWCAQHENALACWRVDMDNLSKRHAAELASVTAERDDLKEWKVLHAKFDACAENDQLRVEREVAEAGRCSALSELHDADLRLADAAAECGRLRDNLRVAEDRTAHAEGGKSVLQKNVVALHDTVRDLQAEVEYLTAWKRDAEQLRRDLDAATASLGRVRAISANYRTMAVLDDEERRKNLRVADAIDRALEG
jgi:chromosome segregation ATPase